MTRYAPFKALTLEEYAERLAKDFPESLLYLNSQDGTTNLVSEDRMLPVALMQVRYKPNGVDEYRMELRSPEEAKSRRREAFCPICGSTVIPHVAKIANGPSPHFEHRAGESSFCPLASARRNGSAEARADVDVFI